MSYNVIERGRTPVQFRDQLVNLVNSRFDYSEKYFYPVRARLSRLYDVWRGIYTGRFHPHKNNVHVPLIYAAIWSDAARKVQASLAQNPIVQFRGFGPDDKPIALKNENLVSAQISDAQGFIKEVNTHVIAGLYGTATSKLMWDRKWETVEYDDWQTQALTGERVRQIKTGKVITFDGPNWHNVDRLDLYPQPGFRLISDMKWCGDRYYLDLDDCRFLSRPGPDGRPALFDPAEVDRMEREGGFADKVASDVAQRKYMARLGMADDMAQTLDKFSRPVEIREYFGVIPSELALDGGVTLTMITVMNRRYLARAKGIPMRHRKKPYHTHAPMPDPHYFDAPGKAEIAEKLQLTANRYVNQRLDATDIVIDPQIFYDRNAGIITDGLYSKPGGWIATDGSPMDKVMPMPVDLRGIQAGGAMTAEMTGYVERATGITDDTIQGLSGGPDRETARGYLGRREAAGTRLMLETLIYERQYLESLANQMQRLNSQYLEGPVEISMIGDNAEIDPDTQTPIKDTRQTMEGYELAYSYAARAVGATNNLSRMMRRQELIPLLQAVTTNPASAGAVNMLNFIREIFREFEFDNVNELINQNQGALRQTIDQTGAQNAAGVPDTAAGGDAAMQMAQLLGQ